MSFGSFFAGLAGLTANNQRLSVIGNNLANLNTLAFKTSRVTFHDIFSGFASFNGAGNPSQIGRGTQVAGIDPIFSQGSLSSTQLLTDLAIQGNGYFVVSDAAGAQAYTRAGNFTFDSDGNMIANSGAFVQGFTQLDAQGNIVTAGALSDIQLPTGLTAPPQATTSFDTRINLDAALSQDFSTTITVFDSLGQRHNVTLTFTPTDTDADTIPDAWTYDVSAPGAEVAGGVAGTPFSLASGLITFDSAGQLTLPAGNPAINIPGWTNGAAGQTVDWEIFDSAGVGQLTGFASPSSISASNQNGFGVGTLRNLIIDQDGLVSGIFTNGVNLQLARVALATFNNQAGLLRVGRNNFLETNSSGTPTIGSPNTGGRGLTVANSLELSNVDITQEFTDLIISQRGYQANSRIITTTDEVIQEALSLKR